MMRLFKKEEVTETQDFVITEGIYKGVFTAKIVDPFFGSEIASSKASLEINLVKKDDVYGLFYASITINNCTYTPEYLSNLFPDINIKTTAEVSIDESNKKVTVKGVFPYISSTEVSGVLSFTQESDGSMSTQSSLMKFSIFARIKKESLTDFAEDLLESDTTKAT